MSRSTVVFSLALLLGVVFLLYQRIQPAFRGNYIVPVRIHLLRATHLPAANCRLTEADVRRIFAKVATIWNQAHIQVVIESIVDEEAANQDSIPAPAGVISFADLQRLRPSASQSDDVIHVYYVHKMPSNGVTQGLDAIFVQETAALRPVEGGIDEPLPRVTAHELGHAFNLPHREAVTNLMASGTTGVALNDDEIATARAAVAGYRFVRRAE